MKKWMNVIQRKHIRWNVKGGGGGAVAPRPGSATAKDRFIEEEVISSILNVQ